MRFASAVSDLPSTADALAAVIESVRAQLDGAGGIDLALLFLSSHHRDEAEWAAERVGVELSPVALAGCTTEGVIAAGREIERSPGVALLAGAMPGVRVGTVAIQEEEWDELLGEQVSLIERLGHGPETRALFAFGDPWTCPVDALLASLTELPLPTIGGMASGARRPGENRLIAGDRVLDAGLVGLTLAGPVVVDPIVSQGCRPIGVRFVVTRGKQNVIEQLGGRPALEQLREVVESIPEADRELLRHGLFLGRAISEYRDTFGRGDFLIRNVLKIDPSSGAIAAADYVKVGQTVQFHVRDAATADEDLRELLARHRPGRPAAAPGPAPAAALLFNCNGRGTNMFDSPGHDVNLLAELLGPGVPVAGFFAAGELGPVGGTNFIHGHTASIALIRPAR